MLKLQMKELKEERKVKRRYNIKWDSYYKIIINIRMGFKMNMLLFPLTTMGGGLVLKPFWALVISSLFFFSAVLCSCCK